MEKCLLSVLLVHTFLLNTGIPSSKEDGRTPVPAGVNTEKDKGIKGLKSLPRRDPGKVGDIVRQDVGGGRIQTVITRAIHPPIFELPDFLTPQECDRMKELAKKRGMKESKVFGKEATYSKVSSRKTLTTFLSGSKHEVLRRIQNRAIHLTKLPKDIVHGSEPFQIGNYPVGGFYKFHSDSEPVTREVMMNKRCCHFMKQQSGKKCTLCRYVTILMYLSDVEEGGETAFPVADQPSPKLTAKVSNISYSCVNAPVLVSPKKGAAVMWYNNIIDPEHGWLGVYDKYAVHGGCPTKKGDKWISNLWINVPQYHSVNSPSIYHDEL